jgi:hypothetical protein
MEQQKKKMGFGKKILIGVGIFVLIGVIGSMFSTEENVNSGEPKMTKESSTTNQNYKKIGEQIEVGKFSYVINDIKFAKTVGNELAQETADGIFLIINLKFRNNDNKERMLDNSLFKLTDKNGTEFESSNEGSGALEMSGMQTLFLKQCNPKIEKSGFLIFEVPTQDIYDLHLSDGNWSGKTEKVKLTK